MKRYLAAFALIASAQVFAQKGVVFIDKPSENKIEVEINGKPFTSYFYPGPNVLKKAVLYPLRTPNGTVVTRGWPLDPRPGERIDHPHHVGMWLNYEDVNDHDFWNNSLTPPNPKATYGTIVHTGVKTMKGGKTSGELTVTADWLDKNGKLMLTETTTYVFSVGKNHYLTDRSTTLTAQTDVLFKDVKDGMFAIRVARQLEHPSNQPEVFTDASGVATKVPVMDNAGVVGNYRNSEGVEGDAVWGKRARWCNLRGQINAETINLAIIDHVKNVGYPSYWHARGYGLFAINPLGQKIFSNGKEELNLKLSSGQSTTFRYRVVVASESLSDDTLNKLAADFDKK
jgi:Methane oxygenase PmoA